MKAEETTGAIAAVILGENAELGVLPSASAAAFPPALGEAAASAVPLDEELDEETVPHAFHNILHDKAAVAAPTYRSLTRICFWIPR